LRLLRFLGCTGDASETAVMTGGEDATFLAAMAPVSMGSQAQVMRRFVHTLAAEQPLPRRARLLAGAFTDPGLAARSLSAHCEVGARLAARLGMSRAVTESLAHAYERWDGKGFPQKLAGQAVPLPVRVVVVARDLELWSREVGSPVADDVLLRRRGRAYDPTVVDVCRDIGQNFLAGLQDRDVWGAVLAAEPSPVRFVDPPEIDSGLAAFADFADLKSPWTRGHSPRVAELAEEAGRQLGLPAVDLVRLRRAGLVHDIGRVAVSAGVWDTAGPLSIGQQEQVRLHPYYGERILLRCPPLLPLAALAGQHHERLDSSGYHRGCPGEQLSTSARLLAAADVWAALTADRPHRPALSADAAGAAIRAERGLDRAAVEVVLGPGGQLPIRSTRTARSPAGLSDREVEVLGLIARGRSNREVAQMLVLSRRPWAGTSRTSTPRSVSGPGPPQRCSRWRTGCSPEPFAELGCSPDAAHRPPAHSGTHQIPTSGATR
jgi:HD-GYP domain-containing protein (c-di-GMP phosphodiesterase class II)